MKRMLITLAAGMVLALPLVSHADPQSDLKAFQAYFKKRFPTVPFDQYSNGVYALPTAKDRREQWEAIMQFPPYEFELDHGKQLWEKYKLASCFKNGGKDIAQNYPYWDPKTKMVRTLTLDINACMESKGEKPFKNLLKGDLADVAAYMKSLSLGQRVKIDLSDPGAIAAYERGKKFYWSRRGQLNFSCATCHVYNAGRQLRGNIISAGLGHGVGFPAYRSKWGDIGTLDRRYIGCNKQVRAKPFAPQSQEYRDLELYETYMDTGLPLSAPSARE